MPIEAVNPKKFTNLISFSSNSSVTDFVLDFVLVFDQTLLAKPKYINTAKAAINKIVPIVKNISSIIPSWLEPLTDVSYCTGCLSSVPN